MGDLLVEYLTLGSIGRETLLLPDPNSDESVDQSPDAFKRKNESALENVEALSGYSGHYSGLSISKKHIPEYSNYQL